MKTIYKKSPFYYLFVVFIMFIVISCHDEEQTIKTINLSENTFVFEPQNPTPNEHVSIITYGCNYNVLASVNKNQNDIVIKKRFNSQMKWPCILELDTISLGTLNQGTYEVSLQIVDINPMIADSVFSEKKLSLSVSN